MEVVVSPRRDVTPTYAEESPSELNLRDLSANHLTQLCQDGFVPQDQLRLRFWIHYWIQLRFSLIKEQDVIGKIWFLPWLPPLVEKQWDLKYFPITKFELTKL